MMLKQCASICSRMMHAYMPRLCDAPMPLAMHGRTDGLTQNLLILRNQSSGPYRVRWREFDSVGMTHQRTTGGNT